MASSAFAIQVWRHFDARMRSRENRIAESNDLLAFQNLMNLLNC